MDEIQIFSHSQKELCIIVDPIHFWQITTTPIFIYNLVGYFHSRAQFGLYITLHSKYFCTGIHICIYLSHYIPSIFCTGILIHI